MVDFIAVACPAYLGNNHTEAQEFVIEKDVFKMLGYDYSPIFFRNTNEGAVSLATLTLGQQQSNSNWKMQMDNLYSKRVQRTFPM